MAANITPNIAVRVASNAVAPCVVQAHARGTTAVQNDGSTAVAFPAHALNYEWDFGDPNTAETFTDPVTGAASSSNKQTGVQACHTYTAAGTYTITLTVRYFDTVASVWVVRTTTTTVSVASSALYDVAYFDSNAPNGGDGTQGNPYNTLAALRAFVNRRSSVIAYIASGSVFEEGSDADVLTLTEADKVRIRKYTPGGSTNAANPVLRLAASSTNRAVVRVIGAIGTTANTIQSVTVAATSGQFKLTFSDEVGASVVTQTTADIAYNAPAGTVQTALEDLEGIGAGDVGVTLSAGVYAITFQSSLASKDIRRLTVTPGTTPYAGGTITSAVAAYGRSARSKVSDVVIEGIDLDGNSATGSRGVSIDVASTPNAGLTENFYLRNCRTLRTKAHGWYTQPAKNEAGSDGPRGHGAIRSSFTLADSGSAGHTVAVATLSFLSLVGCAFSGGDGDASTDHHLTTAEWSDNSTHTHSLIKYCGVLSSSKKLAAVALRGGVQQSLVQSCNLTGAQHGLTIDRVSGTQTMPQDVIVDSVSFNNLGVTGQTTARGVYLKVAANVTIRNSLFYENGYAGTAVANGEDVIVDDASGAEGGNTDPIRIRHCSFYRSVGRAAAPVLRINDSRWLAVENNAIRYDGAAGSANAIVFFGSGLTATAVRTDAISGKIVFRSNVYYAPYAIRSGESQPFAFNNGALWVPFSVGGDATLNRLADWKNVGNAVAGGDPVPTDYFDVDGRYADPEFRNPTAGVFRYGVSDPLVGTAVSNGAGNNLGVYLDYTGAARLGLTIDSGAFQANATQTGSAPYVYGPAPQLNLPTANGQVYNGGDVKLVEMLEPAYANPGDLANDVTNRPAIHLAGRDNIIATSVGGLLTDVNDAFCATPQTGSFLVGPHRTIKSFISVGHNPDGTLKLTPEALAALGFLRVDGQNQMLADLPFGGNRGINLAPGVANSDAASVGQVVLITGSTMTGTLGIRNAGITMSGTSGSNQIQMNNSKITGLAPGVDDSDAVRVDQLRNIFGLTAVAEHYRFAMIAGASTSGPSSFRVKYGNIVSDPIANTANAATVKAALEAMSNIGVGNVEVSGPYTTATDGRRNDMVGGSSRWFRVALRGTALATASDPVFFPTVTPYYGYLPIRSMLNNGTTAIHESFLSGSGYVYSAEDPLVVTRASLTPGDWLVTGAVRMSHPGGVNERLAQFTINGDAMPPVHVGMLSDRIASGHGLAAINKIITVPPSGTYGGKLELKITHAVPAAGQYITVEDVQLLLTRVAL